MMLMLMHDVDDVIGYDDDVDSDDEHDTWVESGAQASAYTGLELVARVERSIPLLHKNHCLSLTF